MSVRGGKEKNTTLPPLTVLPEKRTRVTTTFLTDLFQFRGMFESRIGKVRVCVCVACGINLG